MSLQDTEIKVEYRSPGDNMVTSFYIPLLKDAVMYKRSVGFFSSTSLIDISKGITSLVKNGGHIQMIASPHLSPDDIEAINKGYEERNAVIERRLLEGLDEEYTDYFSTERLNLLANLIADGRMDFHIAFVETDGKIGMYHEKLGIITDADGNSVAFSGSMNESDTGIKVNYETTDVFRSWAEPERVAIKEAAFDKLWNDSDPKVRILDFPSIPKKILEKFKKGKPNFNIDDEQFPERIFSAEPPNKTPENKPAGARIPPNVELYDYQNRAITRWAEENYRGIYDMATGSGKTLTALGSIARLSEDMRDTVAVIIVCPYKHLVDQWVEDIDRFNMNPIIGHSESVQKHWKKMLKDAVQGQTLGVSPFFCFICTNATFKSNFVQEQISRITTPILLVIDEAHNAGAAGFMQYLDDRFTYRLALSATLERHMDEEGTQALYDFFGSPCIHYSLAQAISEKKLTPYRYYTVVVSLTDEELEEYNAKTREMGRCYIKGKNGKRHLSEYGKMLAIQRAHIVAAASEKIEKLREVIQPYLKKRNILVYCGAANVLREEAEESETVDSDIKQIQAVTRLLGNELDMSVSKFTAEESAEERKMIKEHFANGDLQAIAAIKCLDEGMNIPGISTAFILASSTNPKEYVQRRGRVLRRAKGKEYAEIYDFITLPRPLESVAGKTVEEVRYDKMLAINEIRRMKEFASTAVNGMDAMSLIWEIQTAYGITDKDIKGGDHE